MRWSGAVPLLPVLLASLASAVEPAARPVLPPSPRYAFQAMGETQGLATKTVVSLWQDARGFLWIGTQDGLLRYDGAGFRRYDRSDGLPDGYAGGILESAQGDLWAVTQTGVARFDGRGFRAARLPGKLELVGRPQAAALDPSGRLYVATSGGLVRLVGPADPSPRVFASLPGSPPGGTLTDPAIEAVHVAADGAVLFAASRRLFALRNDVVEAVPCPELPVPGVVAILTDGRGTLWVRTPSRLLRRDPGSAELVFDDEGLPNANDFGVPVLDRTGRLLIPTVLGLYAKAWGVAGGSEGPGAPWVGLTMKQGLRSNAVGAVAEDREGALWIGYGGAGLDRWPGRFAWSAWSVPEGLPDEVVWCTARDRKGRLWIGTNAGLALFDGRGFRTWTDREGLAGRTVRTLSVSADGKICVWSVPGGLTVVDPDTLALRRIDLSVADASGAIVSVAPAPDGTLWAGSRRGLHRIGLQPGARPSVVELPEDALGATTLVNVTADGVLWATGRRGLLRYDGRSFRRFSSQDGLRADSVSYAAPVSANEVWFAYRDSPGVSHLLLDGERATLRHFDREKGLLSDSPYFLGVARGRVYVGTDSGVSVIGENGRVRTYDRWDGLIWNDCSGDAFLEDTDGALLIGTSRGLARFDPTAPEAPLLPPPVVLTSAKLGGRERLGDGGAPLVPFRDRALFVQFSGLTFRNPSEVRFRYRLEGLEPDANETAAREARYSGLAPGTYRFEVSCRSASGLFSQAPASFSFTVQPPWWQALWFRLLVALSLVVLALGVYRLRVRHLVRAKKHLEGVVASRTLLLNQRNEELQTALVKLSDAQKQILQLSQRSSGRLDDLAAWTAETAREIGTLVGLPGLDVVVLDGERVRSMAGTSLQLPSARLLEGARGPVAGEDGKSTLLPILGPTGQPRGALVVPRESAALGETERQLLESFASHLGATLDLSKMRDRLTRAESERARSVRELSSLGIDTVRVCPRCRRCYDQRTERCALDGTPLEAERLLPLVIGDRYRLTRFLGEGGMGSVYRGADQKLQREVAIKIILAEHLNDPLVRSRFEREARIMTRIKHPGVVTLHDQGELPDGSAYLVIELLEGMDLAQLLDIHGPGTPQQVARVLLQVGDALSAAHLEGVIHRDLKPANLFLVRGPSGDFQAKVMDFGLAKATREPAGTKATKTGFIVGSPAYMSPEQVREEPVDGRSDLFSLASVTYELLTGVAAFRAPNVADILTKVLQRDPPPLSTWIKDLPRELEKAFFEAFEKDPARRPPTVMAWVERLAPLIEALPTPASVKGWPSRLTSRG